ncbi:hypothetical protein BDR07DRAFT_1417892 [Suillus spraguei]|nr:hypothetical protein BDR07DRAFT_1417892 [Suillus spraguei]
MPPGPNQHTVCLSLMARFVNSATDPHVHKIWRDIAKHWWVIVFLDIPINIALESQSLRVHFTRETNEHLSTEKWDDAIQISFPSNDAVAIVCDKQESLPKPLLLFEATSLLMKFNDLFNYDPSILADHRWCHAWSPFQKFP